MVLERKFQGRQIEGKKEKKIPLNTVKLKRKANMAPYKKMSVVPTKKEKKIQLNIVKLEK